MPAADNCRAIASVSVPLRAISASRPGLQKLGAIEPSSPRPGTYMPSVLGPMSQHPAARARDVTSSASCTGTYSATATMVRTRAAMQSATASRKPSGGV